MTQETSYQYALIRRAIDVIDANPNAHSLNELVAEFGMSPTHLKRTFSEWVGVSPKNYQQYLTLDHAKTLLRDRFTTLGTAHSVGLSGTSRLHDLFIRWNAISPRTYSAKGEGLTIMEGWFDSPFSDMIVMGTDCGICGLGFAAEMGRDAARDDLVKRWPLATYQDGKDQLAPWVAAFLKGTGETKLQLMGSQLQIKVWEALLNIPSGHVTTYSEIAHRIGSPKAVRAVGTAVGRNPIGMMIPCHRALRKSGALGGYHWGLQLKRAMLAYEGARSDAA